MLAVKKLPGDSVSTLRNKKMGDTDDRFGYSFETDSTRETARERQQSLGSSASADLLSWNHRQGRTGSVTLVARDLLKTTYVTKDPSSVEDVYNIRKTLTFCMKSAIKKSVRDQAYSVRRELSQKDFNQVSKITFDAKDPANLIGKVFKFKDYAPAVFKTLRQNFRIDEKEYLESLTDTDLDNFQSSSKSGSFFFFSGDGQYLIKGTTQQEARFFLHILQDYCGHMRRSQNSLLVRFCGLYRLKVPHIRKRTHFIVMRSVYSESEFHPCHVVYDLKGSTIGRMSEHGSHVKKDVDFIEERLKKGRLITLGSENERNTFISSLKNDVVWLQKNNIMDYSLLVGIHDKNRPLVRQTVLNLKSGRFEDVDLSSIAKKEAYNQVRKSTLSRFSVINAEEVNETYYIAIIDILQPYNAKKKAENFVKSMYLDGECISAIPSKDYGDRFFDFILQATTATNVKDVTPFMTKPKKAKRKTGSNKSGKIKHQDKDKLYTVI